MMNKIEKILLVGSSFWYFGEGMLGPLFAIFAERIGGDILEITWAWATYVLAIGILTLILGKYSDKCNKGKMMILGYGLNAIFTLGYLFVKTPVSLLLVQAGLGLACALATPTWDALYSEHVNRKKEGNAWGLADGLPYLVTGISIIIGGLIVTYYSFNYLFITMGIIQILATIYQARILYFKKNKNC